MLETKVITFILNKETIDPTLRLSMEETEFTYFNIFIRKHFQLQMYHVQANPPIQDNKNLRKNMRQNMK